MRYTPFYCTATGEIKEARILMPNREFFIANHPTVAIEKGIEQLKGLLNGYNGYSSRLFDHDVKADINDEYIVLAYRVGNFETLYWNKKESIYRNCANSITLALANEALHRKLTIIDRRTP